MRVKWREYISLPDYGGQDAYEGLKPEDLRNDYEGEVIGTNSSFWHGETLTVACTDNKVRTVAQDKVKILK